MVNATFHNSVVPFSDQLKFHFPFIVLQVARVFYYLSAAALQYLAPTILLLFSVLMLRTLGGFTVCVLVVEPAGQS